MFWMVFGELGSYLKHLGDEQFWLHQKCSASDNMIMYILITYSADPMGGHTPQYFREKCTCL